MVNLETIESFVNHYWSQPFWRSAKVEEPWIRLKLLASDRARPDLPKSIVTSYRRSELGQMKDHLKRANRAGYNCYYFINVLPADPREWNQAGDEDVTNILFLPLDWDVQLPVGMKRLWSVLGLDPWYQCVTSRLRMGGSKRQALVAVDLDSGARGNVEDYSERVAKYWEAAQRIARVMNRELGGCRNLVCNPCQVMRLPGCINWNSNTEVIVEREGKTVYTLEEIIERMSIFRGSELVDLIQVQPEPGYVNGVSFVHHLGGGSTVSSFDLKGELLKAKKGEIVLEVGQRDNYMARAAGAIAGVRGWSKERKDKALELFAGCMREGGSSGEAEKIAEKSGRNREKFEERDFEKRVEGLGAINGVSFEEADDKHIRAQLSARMNGPASLGKVKGKKGKVAGKSEPQPIDTVSAIDFEDADLFDSMLKRCVAKLREYGGERSYLKWRGMFADKLAVCMDSTGVADVVMVCLLDRCVECGLLTRLGFCVPMRMKSAIGRGANVLCVVASPEDTSFNAVLGYVLNSVVAELVRADKRFKKFSYSGAFKRNLLVAAKDPVRACAMSLPDPFSEEWSIVCQNGKVDLRGGEFVNGEFAFNSLSTTHFEVVEKEWEGIKSDLASSSGTAGSFVEGLERRAPLFSQMLHAWHPIEGEGDELTWRGLLAMMGYCFTPQSKLQLVFNLHGPGLSGKSTFALMICDLLGRHAYMPSTLHELVADYEGASRYYGKTLVFLDEAEGDEKVVRKAVEKLKRMTGGGETTERGIYAARMRGVMHAKFVLTTNEVLPYDDSQGALKRRFVVPHFNNPVMPSAQRSSWREEVLREEFDIIGTYACAALAAVWSQGRKMFEIGSPAFVAGSDALRAVTSPIGAAVDKIFEISQNHDYALPLNTAIAVMRHYAEENNEDTLLAIIVGGSRIKLIETIERSVVMAGGKYGCQRKESDTRGRLSRKYGRIKVPILKGVRIKRKFLSQELLDQWGLDPDAWGLNNSDGNWLKDKEMMTWLKK